MLLFVGIKGYGDVWNYDLFVIYGGNEFEYGVINILNMFLGLMS